MTESTTADGSAALAAYAHEVYAFSRTVSRRLMIWSILSVVAGALLWRRGAPFWRGVGVQSAAWGAIDGIIAGSGLLTQRQPPPAPARSARNLRRLLWFNTVLDVGYVAGGLWLARTKGRNDADWRGQGLGIVVQGGFLFLFDLVHVLRLPGPGVDASG